MIDCHFGLGMWIRNEYIYKGGIEYPEEILNKYSGGGNMPFLIHPDNESELVIDAVWEKLNQIG